MADDLVEAGLISVFNKSAKFSPTLIKRDHAIRTLGDEEYRAGTIGIDHIFKTVLKVNHGQEAIHEKNDSDDEDYAVHDSNNPKIFVKTSSRKIIAINISLSATVDELKSIVQEREGIPIPKQQLLLCGRLLGEGGRTLQDCNVQEGATLHVIDSTVDPMVEVFVKTLTGRTISLQIPLSTSVEDVRAFIQDREGIPEDHQRLLIGGQQMDDGRSLAEYNVMEWSTIHLVLRLRGGGFSCYHTEMKYFDEAFNYDFSKFPADTVRYYRGGQQYHRPIGSKRYALKVLDKYGENDWLGGNGIRTTSARGEWPVAYHGTHEMNVKNIATDGLRLANGKRFLFGKGIYCTPDPKTALQYGHEFEHENGKWKLILQLRVRPDKIKKIAASRTPVGCGEYWVMPDDSCLRLYGICVYKVPSPVPDD